MYFFEDTCMPDDEFEISFCEDVLELNILNHNVLNILGIYEQSFMFEDGDESSSSNGVFEKLKAAILSMLNKIGNIASGVIDSFKSLSADRITYDDYKNSATGQLRLSEDLFEIQRDLDKEYQRMRPVVSKLADMTGQDIDKVEQICDTVTENIHNNGKKYAKDVSKVVTLKAMNKLSEDIVSQMTDVQNWRSETSKSVNRMKRNTDPVKLRVMNKCVKCMGDMTNAYKSLGSKAKSALDSATKKFKKEREEN